MVFPFGNCGLCRPQRESGAGAGPLEAATAAAPRAPTQPVSVPQMLRSKSEARILRLDVGAGDVGMCRSQSMPSSSLLEASRRRLAAAAAAEAAARAAQQAAADGSAARDFVNQYMQAIKDNNTSWASAPAVCELFIKDALMVAADRQSFHGRAALVRRLNQGVETLARMAGDQPELPTFELAEPEAAPGGQGLVLRLTLRRGMHKMAFAMTFTMRDGKIAALRNSRS